MNDIVGRELQVSDTGAAIRTDVVMDNEGTLGGLQGPWMNVAAHRKSKVVFKDMGNKGSGNKSQGSRFDILREVDETVGVVKVFASGSKTQKGSFKQDDELGSKV